MHRAFALGFWLASSGLFAGVAAAQPGRPARSEDVSFRSGDVIIACTLALPPGPGPFPAIVLLSGDGQQDRDWTFGKLKMARALSEGLNRRGVAALRCDDRGEGGSGGGSEQQARYQDLSGDARAALRLLRGRPDIARAGLLGHSGGSSVAILTATSDPAAADFVVTLSGPFLSGEEVLVAQARSMPRIYRGAVNQPDAEASLEGERIARRIGAWVRTGEGLEEIRAAWDRILRARVRSWPAERREAALMEAGSEDAFVDGALGEILGEYQSPLGRDFVTFDPAKEVAKVGCPLLVVFGDKDAHVSVALHRPPLMRSLADGRSGDVTVRVVPEADHAYTTGALYEKGEILPGVAELIADWVRARS